MAGEIVRVSVADFPIVVITCPRALALASVEQLKARFDQILAQGERYVVLTDTRPVEVLPDAVVRRALGNWWREFDETSRGLSLGSATIIDRPLVRSMLTAVSWFHRAATPQYYASDMADAERWCRDQLSRHGL